MKMRSIRDTAPGSEKIWAFRLCTSKTEKPFGELVFSLWSAESVCSQSGEMFKIVPKLLSVNIPSYMGISIVYQQDSQTR